MENEKIHLDDDWKYEKFESKKKRNPLKELKPKIHAALA